MLTCVIVDDEKGAIDILTEYVQRTPDLHLESAFRDSVEALNHLSKSETDLLFLDIDMPGLSGMQIADLLRSRNIQVVFCTAYAEYAVESYERDAADYLLKPIAYDRFLKAVDRVRRRLEEMPKRSKPADSEGRLFIKSGSKIHQLDLHDLCYMKKDGHYIVFHTTQGEILSRMNMKELLSSLPRDRYARVHKSYVIALDKIDTIERHEVIVAGRTIPIGSSFREDFLKLIRYSGS